MRTFSQRLALHFAVLATLTAGLVLAAGGWLLDREMRRNLELLHASEHRELRELLGADGRIAPAEVERRLRIDTENDGALYLVQVRDATGAVVFRSRNLGEALIPELPAGAAHGEIELPGPGRLYVSEYRDGAWRLAVASPLRMVDQLLTDYARIALMLAAGVVALGLALGHALSRLTLQPLRAIADTANRIRSDNLAERIPAPGGRDELASLVRLLNQMFDRLQASFEQMGRFAADVSHEVKTPLALIRLNAERLRARAAGDAELAAAAGDILEEIERLNQVTDRLLFLARAESGALELSRRPLAVRALLGPLAEDAQALAGDRGVRFALEGGDEGELRADPALLHQLLLNLLANAVSVSPRGGLVVLRSAAVPGGWRFEVIDEGPGLEEAQLARLFGRFVRFERAGAAGAPAGRAGHGHGLGLAISRSIAALHQGTVRAENRSDRSGLRILVDLPR